MRLLSVVFLLLALVNGRAATSAAPAPSSPPPPTAAAELSTGDAIILGVVEGVTEYLPISSTGHLIIANRALGLESDRPLLDSAGQPLWYKKPSAKYPNGVPLTLKLAADTYTVIIQFGAIAAVALLYWSQLFSMWRGLLGRDPAGRQLLVNVIVAFIPAAAIGFLAKDWIDSFFSVRVVIVTQIAGAFLMFYAEAWRRRRAAAHTSSIPDAGELTPRAAAGIGALQCLALAPGTSRSMTTIVGGYFAGLHPKHAAEFSFILGFVTLTAASLYKGATHGAAMIRVFGWSHVILGAMVAAITAAICVRFLVRWLTRHGLAVFGWYRIALAIFLATWLYLGK